MIKEIAENWYFIPILMVAVYLYAWLLNYALFRPVMKVLDERESRTRDAAAELGSSRDSLKARLEEYEAAVLEAHREGNRVKEAAREKAEAERRKKLDELKVTLSAEKNSRLKELEKETRNVRKELASRIPAFANEVAERLLGREVAS